MGAPSGLSGTSRKLWHLCKVLYGLEHKTQYLWSMCHLPALWYFDISVICPHRFCWVKFVLIPPCFVLQQYLWNICEISSVSCYNVWANSCCSGCSPLWEKSLRNGTITWANDDLCLCRHMTSLGFSELTLTFTCFSHSYPVQYFKFWGIFSFWNTTSLKFGRKLISLARYLSMVVNGGAYLCPNVMSLD